MVRAEDGTCNGSFASAGHGLRLEIMGVAHPDFPRLQKGPCSSGLATQSSALRRVSEPVGLEATWVLD